MKEKKYDLAIIGSGPGGYVSAIRARQLGLSVVLIEKDALGGVCLNWGCIPSKALIHKASIINELPELASMGITANKADLDYSKVQGISRKAALKLSKGVEMLLKKNTVDVIKGYATIKSPKKIEIEGHDAIEADHIMISTGASPKEIPGFEFDENLVLSSTGILAMKDLPKRMIILGAGVIGIEFAYVLHSFGVEVTLVEMLPTILPTEDEETSGLLHTIFMKRGINIMVSTKANKLVKNEDSVSLHIEDSSGKQSILTADKMLVSVGRTPNTDNLGLDKIGVKTEQGFVQVKDFNETSVPNIYAVGDVVGTTPLLAHVASKEGEIVVEHIAGVGHIAHMDKLGIPSAIYSEPQIGSFGLTEQEAKKEGIAYRASKFPFVGVGKAVAVDKSQGFVKIITKKDDGEIIGVHAIGYNATEIIHELLVARCGELVIDDIATMIHAHPTISEGVMESARDSLGWAIHI